jgi:hypothetical protein
MKVRSRLQLKWRKMLRWLRQRLATRLRWKEKVSRSGTIEQRDDCC